MITLKCENCKKTFEKTNSEYNRRIQNGQTRFFCSRQCANMTINQPFPKIRKRCPVCRKEFLTSGGKKGATFCSRSCASKGSVSEHRRIVARETSSKNFVHASSVSAQHLLKCRESFKYQQLEEFLSKMNIAYEFEYLLNDFIYDLALLDEKILIEFDGKDHRYIDETEKTKNAKDSGFTLYRVNVDANSVISPEEIVKLGIF